MSIAKVNLISPQRAAAARRRVLTRRWAKGLGFYALVLTVLGVALHGTASRQQELRDAVQQLESKVESRRASLASERTRIDGLRKSLRAAQAVGVHADWGKVLTRAAIGAGEQITIERIDLDVARTEPLQQAGRGQKRTTRDRQTTRTATIVISGLASSTTAAQQYSVRLEDLRFFDQVRMTETTQAGAGESVRFEIRCTLADGAPQSIGDKR
jgi:Tfp pilus assembly protein PilN